jgi:hypothetical protein
VTSVTRRVAPAVACLLLFAGCNGAAPATDGSGPGEPSPGGQEAPPGAETPAAAVGELFEALAGDDIEAAADLTVPGQAVAVAVAERAPADEVLAILDTGGRPVLVNFWRSFAASVVELSGAPIGDLEPGDAGEPFEVGGRRFAIVEVLVPGQGAQSFVVRELDGWKVDLVATFAPALAANLGKAPETFGGVAGGDRIVAAVRDERAALEAALADPALPSEMGQIVRAAVVALGGR